MQINKSQITVIETAINNLFAIGEDCKDNQKLQAAQEMLNRVKSELGALPNTCLEFSTNSGKSSVMEKGVKITLDGKKGQTALVQWAFAVLRTDEALRIQCNLAASDDMAQVSKACVAQAKATIAKKAKAEQNATQAAAA